MAEPGRADFALVAIVPKNSREEVRVRLSTFHGQRLADVRVFVDSDRSDDRVPTKKGVSVQLDTLPALIEALQAAARG